LVEVAAGSAADPRPMPKLVASCSTPVADGMVIKNKTSDRVKENRAGVVEFLLINHPLDCPICDQAGECHLQDLGYEHGKAKTRYEEERRTFDPIDIGDKIKLHMNRCILCYRCVHTANQLTDQRVHGVLNRGEHAEISTYIEKAIDNDFSGNVIDVCPVGALTDKTFRFKSRVWFLKPMEGECNCEKCSGKAVLWMFGNEIYRVTSRKDQYGEVEDIDGKTAWICNDCRFDKKDVSKWTITGPRVVDRHSVISQGKYETKMNTKIKRIN
jgi:NADH-quinone oxidoreductase subunit G